MNKMPVNIIKVPSDLSIYYAIQAEELVDNTFGEGMFFKQTWDSSIHQWFLLNNDQLPYSVYPSQQFLGGYCSVQIKQEGSLGILKTSVVNMTRSGFGDAMVKHRIKWLQEQNVQTIKSYAWFVDGVVPAQKMLMNNGFEPRDDIRGYWNKDHNKAFPCKICGANCKCVARIFEYKG
mgnify:CR=1 FL=1